MVLCGYCAVQRSEVTARYIHRAWVRYMDMSMSMSMYVVVVVVRTMVRCPLVRSAAAGGATVPVHLAGLVCSRVFVLHMGSQVGGSWWWCGLSFQDSGDCRPARSAPGRRATRAATACR